MRRRLIARPTSCVWLGVLGALCWLGIARAAAFEKPIEEPDDAEEVRVGDEGVNTAPSATADDGLQVVEQPQPLEEIEFSADETSTDEEAKQDVVPASYDEAWDESNGALEDNLVPTDVQPIADVPAGDSALMQPDAAAPPATSPGSPPGDTSAQGPRGIAVEAARFKGLQPGGSSRADVDQTLGEPSKVTHADDSVEAVYAVPPFERLTAVFRDDRLLSMVIDLKQTFPADALAKELALDSIDVVHVADDAGQIIGQSFPERGVLFSFGPGGQAGQVVQIILDSIDAQPFVARAETTRTLQAGAALADVDQALRLDPQFGRAHWLRSLILLDLGRPAEASSAADAALGVEPHLPEYRLAYARALGEAGDHPQAIELLETLAGSDGLSADLQAEARLHLGNHRSQSAERDYKRALDDHLQAIKLAEPLVGDARAEARQRAREVLLDGHLAIANDIAWGGWRSKTTVVPQWLERGAGIARKLDPVLADDYRFRVARASLSAMAGFQGRQDISGYVKEAVEAGEALIGAAREPLTRQQRQWDLALALYDALQIEHLRGRFDEALAQGQKAAELFAEAAPLREAMPGQSYMLGRLYFRLGSIEAIHHRQHDRAVTWFDKATPLLEEPIPSSSVGDVGRQGETLVSMAVSYWEVGQRENAVRLTSDGVNLMSQAVDDGLLEQTALAVPYHNLSRMHRTLGDDDAAQNFEQMASQSRSATRR